MGVVRINHYTVKDPLNMIGELSGICWGSPIDNDEKNIKRALDCLNKRHGRTLEFPDIYLNLDGYSARVMREWYTHIGGAPTRLQESTRFVTEDNFTMIIPPSIKNNDDALKVYLDLQENVRTAYKQLNELNVPKEDSAMVLPLGMDSNMVDKCNFRHLVDMSKQRMCSKAYWEYRELFNDLRDALSAYSIQWKYLVQNYFYPKCKELGFCPEGNRGCGKYPPAPKMVFDKLIPYLKDYLQPVTSGEDVNLRNDNWTEEAQKEITYQQDFNF